MKFTRRLCAFVLTGTLLSGGLFSLPAQAAEGGDVLWLDAFDEIYSFSCGYAYVSKGNTSYFVNPSGVRLAVDPALDCVGPFQNGFAPVRPAGTNKPTEYPQTLGWMGLDGTLALPFDSFDTCYAAFQRNTLFTTGRDGQPVTLGADGQVIAQAPDGLILTDLPWANYNGLVPVYEVQEDGNLKLGFADWNWALVIPPQYDNSYSGFTQGGALVSQPDTDDYYYINCQGEKIWGPINWEDDGWLESTSGFWDGLLPVPDKNGMWGAVDTHGELVIPYEYEQPFYFSSGYAFVVKEGTLQVIDTSGETLLTDAAVSPDPSGFSYSYSEGLAAVCNGGKWGYMDTSGQVVIPCVYADALPFSEGLAWVQRENGVWGILKSPLAEQSSWAEEEIRRAYVREIVTERTACNFQSSLTRLQCAELMVNLAELATGRPILEAEANRFTDTKDWMARKGAAAGIIEGVEDGSKFAPDTVVTREQLATMLYRAVRYIESQTGTTILILTEQGSLSGYTDAAQVSPWAQEAMAALHTAGILKGTSGTTLSPKDTTTVEQGILLALRAYEMEAGE